MANILRLIAELTTALELNEREIREFEDFELIEKSADLIELLYESTQL